MLKSMIGLLSRRRHYRYIAIGSLLSSMGSGLTQVAVYGELNKLNASAAMFTAAFALSVIPGLFSSQTGLWLLKRFRPLSVLFWAELAGAVTVLIPLSGSLLHDTHLLQLSQFVSALLAGLVIPACNALFSTYFTDEELPAVSSIGSYIFSANVLVGYGVGTLLFGLVPVNTYFLLDLLSFLAGAAMIALAFRGDPQLRARAKASPGGARQTLHWDRLSPTQKRAFLLLPALTLAGTPAVALLPMLARHHGIQFELSGFVVNTVMLFLFAKTLGQMAGPLLLHPRHFDRLLGDRRSLLALVLAFGTLYWIAARSRFLWIALACIVLAHIFSNLIYVVATYSLPRHFKGEAAGIAAARQYQLQVILMAVYALGSGFAAEWASVSAVIGVNILLSGALILRLLRGETIAPVAEPDPEAKTR